MAGKILGIEIRSRLTRVVELDAKKGNPKIYGHCCFDTPEGTIVDGDLVYSQDFAELLKENLKKNHITSRKAVFVVNSSRIAVREVQIPFVKQKRIRGMILANASEYFPVDISQYELGIRMMDTIEEEGKKKYHLALLAMPRDIVETHQKLAAAAGLTFMGMDYEGNSMVRAALYEKGEELCAYVNIDEDSAMVVVCENQKVKLQRTVKYGVAEAMEQLREQGLGEEGTFLDTLVYANKQNCLDSEITESLEPLIGSIERILTYFTSQNNNRSLEQVYVLGIGAKICGLPGLLETELGYPVRTVTELGEKVSLSPGKKESFSVVEYVTCISGATQPIFQGEFLEQKAVQNKGEGEANEPKGIRTACISCGVMVAAAVVLAAYPLVQGMLLQDRRAQLEQQIAAYGSIQLQYDSCEQAKAELKELQQLLRSTDHHTERLVTFIEELEKKMPAEINTLTLSASPDGISMTVRVSSKTAAARVLSELRTFNSIYVEPTASELTDTVEELGQHTVEMIVTCNYQ